MSMEECLNYIIGSSLPLPLLFICLGARIEAAVHRNDDCASSGIGKEIQSGAFIRTMKSFLSAGWNNGGYENASPFRRGR